jgi:hypothetical protein
MQKETGICVTRDVSASGGDACDKHSSRQSERDCSYVVTNPVGKKRSFDNLMDLAQWAAANALGKPESEWLMSGRDVD